MMSRKFVRRILPATYQIIKTTPIEQPIKHAILTSSRASSLCYNRGFVTRWYSQQAEEPKNDLPIVDYDYVKRAITNKNILLVDVRPPDEIKENGKIPNSVNIPVDTVAASLSLSDKDFQKSFNIPKPAADAEIIFYCKIGRRSGIAQQAAHNLGFTNVKNYLGSWTDWKSRQ